MKKNNTDEEELANALEKAKEILRRAGIDVAKLIREDRNTR